MFVKPHLNSIVDIAMQQQAVNLGVCFTISIRNKQAVNLGVCFTISIRNKQAVNLGVCFTIPIRKGISKHHMSIGVKKLQVIMRGTHICLDLS